MLYMLSAIASITIGERFLKVQVLELNFKSINRTSSGVCAELNIVLALEKSYAIRHYNVRSCTTSYYFSICNVLNWNGLPWEYHAEVYVGSGIQVSSLLRMARSCRI